MDSLPKSLLYYTSQISNFTRNCVKVNSLNQTTLASNGVSQIRVAMPVNSVLNLKSLSMHGVVSTTGETADAAGEDNHALIPKGGIGALLQRVTWSAGGVSLDNGPVPYHVIYAVKENLEKGNQKSMSDDRVLQQSNIEDKDSLQEQVGDKPVPALGQQKRLIQNNFLGFSECHPTYLDMSLLPECFLSIQWGPGSLLPLQPSGDTTIGDTAHAGGRNVNFSIDEIFFTVEVCQIGSGMYDALTQRLLAERGSIDVPYPAYQTFSTTTGKDTGVANVRGSISCMSLDRMYAIARENSFNVASEPATCADAVGSKYQQKSINFGSFDLKSWQFSLNNAPMPMYPADPVDAYNFAVCAEDRTYSKNRGSQVSSQAEWLTNKWCATQRLCLDNDPTRLSGVNLSSINATMVFQVVTNGKAADQPAVGLEMMLITQQKSVLRIGQSRAVAVVA